MPNTALVEILLALAIVFFAMLFVYVLIYQRQHERRRTAAARLLAGEMPKAEMPALMRGSGRQFFIRGQFRKRKLLDEIDRHLPNALDLMRVCVDAGLDISAAIARVAQELADSSPNLARMFRDLQLQLKAGASREQAFKALVEQTGSFEMRNLMMSLAEAEELGTSVSRILRTYASELRTRKRIAAEEQGAKLPVKLLFPMLLLLFPAMMIVLVGPAILGAAELLQEFR